MIRIDNEVEYKKLLKKTFEEKNLTDEQINEIYKASKKFYNDISNKIKQEQTAFYQQSGPSRPDTSILLDSESKYSSFDLPSTNKESNQEVLDLHRQWTGSSADLLELDDGLEGWVDETALSEGSETDASDQAGSLILEKEQVDQVAQVQDTSGMTDYFEQMQL